MLLKLQNFCCWENKEFEFPDVGSVLISAPSGTGKTSIMRAIMFALFGVGDKIIRYGKKSCSVELQLHDLHIYRSKGPGRLVVNHSQEDEAGQHIINTYFDNDLFYLQQHGKKNFVSMNSNDKLEYLERILFRHIPLQRLKSDLKQITKDLETTNTAKKTELQMIQNMLSELPTYQHVPPYSEEEFQNLHKSLETSKEEYKTLLEKEKHYREVQHHLQSLSTRIQSETSKQTQYETEYTEYNDKLSTLQFHKEELEECKEQLQQIEYIELYKTQKKEYQEQQRIYENSVKKEKTLLEDKLSHIHDQLQQLTYTSTSDYKKSMDQYKSTLQEHEQYMKWISEKEELIEPSEPLTSEDTIRKVRDEYETLKKQWSDMNTCYTCPKCHVSLKIHKQQLTEHSIPMNKEQCSRTLEEYRTQLDKYERNVREWTKYNDKVKYIDHKLTQYKPCDIETIRQQLEQMEKEYQQFQTWMIQKKDIDKQLQQVVSKYDTLEEYIQKLYKKCKELKAKCSTRSFTEEEKQQIRDRLVEVQSHAKNHQLYSEKYHQYLDLYTRSTTLIKQLQTEHDSLTKRLEDSQIDTLTKLRLEETIEKETRQLTEMKELKHQYQTYVLYTKYIEEERVTKDVLSENEKELQAVYLMKQKILDAEGMALTNLIYTINTTLQMYLDMFFEKEPIQVVLKSYKQVKDSKKSQITIEVNYKGHQVELSCLSGGEYDRVVLSFALTFADLIQSPLLLLDECVSSLDQDTADIVYNGMKQHCSNKLVILVAHQIVTGMFDSILRLK